MWGRRDNTQNTSRLYYSNLRNILVKMADTEERPAKMRKLNSINEMSTKAEAQPELADNTNTNTVPDAPEQFTAKPAHGEPRESNAANALSPEQKAAVEAELQQAIAKNPDISKSQLKKLKKKLEWEAGKESRRVYQKSKEKAKKAAQAEQKKKLAAAGLLAPTPKKPRAPPPITVPVTLLIDSDFDSYMLDKEIMSLGQQITRSYSDVKNGRYRANMVISSFGGRMRERYETVLARHHEAWKGVTFTDKLFTEAAKDAHEKMISKDGGKLAGALAGAEQLDKDKARDKANSEAGVHGVEGDDMPEMSEHKDASEPQNAEAVPSETDLSILFPKPSEPQLVYLSSDSDQDLDRLEPYTTYVIGGIVDKNRHKGLCHARAVELGIPTAKLPIGEYMEMQSRTVLATNHVVEIMVNWLESGDWGEAFLKAIPKRKEATLKRMKANNKTDPENAKKEGDAEHDDDEAEEEEAGRKAEEASKAGFEAVEAAIEAETAQQTEAES